MRVLVVLSRPALAAACTLALPACPPTAPIDETTSTGTSSASTSPPPPTSSTSAAPTTTTTGTTGGEPDTTSPTTNPDALPPAPTLVSPADGAVDVPLVTDLCWDLVMDPDGEPLRYRVFVDDLELTKGVLDPLPGHEGPCVGPLDFTYERTYTWRVEAFELDDPARTSPPSPTWSFSTVGDGMARTVFFDDFDADLGWQIAGDAGTGAWVRGEPVPADKDAVRTQPGACLGGASCYFTGQNPDGVAAMADVSGGATTLTSPPFDLGGAGAATVQLGRFFYKSVVDPGPRLTVELLVPKDGATDEYDSFQLEQLAAATAADPENLWLPREYTICDAPLRDGSRLRISAADLSGGILEAAIDSVKVRAFDDVSVCGIGQGSACDPDSGPAACPGDLLCCSQGTINEGIYRCSTPVPGLVYGDPTPGPDAPGNGPMGCDAPDLIVDTSLLYPIFHTIEVTNNTCEYYEGCVGGLGARDLMLFTTAVPNIGSADLVMGVPANHPELFHYSACHDHYHFDEFARYELLSADDVVAATGHKQAFCMLDTTSWAWPNPLPVFTCANQGISRGFSDHYESGLPCQWIDVTGVSPGDYILRITLNQPRRDSALPLLNERDYANNTLDTPVTIP
ncbi:MAG: hypothetical protein JNL82_41405 [Myxococcales bacterium]|nr:hypothetical protein [Myxococcales bacterium]